MQPIIIIGMHRSGTSMITSILKEIGVFIGDDLEKNNESRLFIQLNEWILSQAGATWDNPYNLQFFNSDFKDQISRNLEKQIHSFKIRNYLGSNKLYFKYRSLQNLNFKWGWKDPRNTFTLELWLNLFPKAKIIHIYRNPIDVSLSLQERAIKYIELRDSLTRTGIKKILNEFILTKKRIYNQSLRVLNLEEGIKLWESYINKAFTFDENKNLEILHLCYEDFLETPDNHIESLTSFLRLPYDKTKTEEVSKTVNKIRKYAFTSNAEYVKLYKKIQNSPLLVKLGYNSIIK